jgi:hypothetical protein
MMSLPDRYPLGTAWITIQPNTNVSGSLICSSMSDRLPSVIAGLGSLLTAMISYC